MARLTLIFVLFVVWGIFQLGKKWLGKKKTAAITKDLAASAEAVDPNDAQSSEEIATLKNTFDEALKALKKSSVGGKKISSIYQLPWYIIIGPPGAGKTTALVNSGLKFPLAEKIGQGAVGGVGGTRNCDWWFTDEAVLIDTAGRYTTQDSPTPKSIKAWLRLPRPAEEASPRQPINGVLVAISVSDLSTPDEVERERARRAPSAAASTNCMNSSASVSRSTCCSPSADLIAGFTEFFDDLARKTAPRSWGFHTTD